MLVQMRNMFFHILIIWVLWQKALTCITDDMCIANRETKRRLYVESAEIAGQLDHQLAFYDMLYFD